MDYLVDLANTTQTVGSATVLLPDVGLGFGGLGGWGVGFVSLGGGGGSGLNVRVYKD